MNFFYQKKHLLLVVVISLALAGAFLLPYILNYNDFTKKFITKVENSLHLKLEMERQPQLQLFPSPRIALSNVKVIFDNDFYKNGIDSSYIKEVSFEIGFMDLLSSKLKVLNTNLIDGDFNVSSLQDLLAIFDDFTFTNFNIFPKISIYNSNINFDDTNMMLDSANIKIQDLEVNNNKMFGSIFFNNEMYDFQSDFNKEIISRLKNKGLEIDFAGQIKYGQLSGNLNVQVLDPSYIIYPIKKFFPLFPYNKESKFKEPLLIQGKLNVSNSMIEVPDLSIDSSYFDGYGALYYFYRDNPEVYLDVFANKIDFDQMYVYDKNKMQNDQIDDFFEDLNNTHSDNKNFFKVQKDDPISYNILIDAREINISGRKVLDMGLEFQVTNEDFNINKISADFQDDLSMILYDSKTVKVENMSVLIGEVEIIANNLRENLEWLGITKFSEVVDKYKNLKLNSKLIFAADEITFKDADVNFGGKNISGRYTIKNIKNRTINDIEINASDLDLNDFIDANLVLYIHDIVTNSTQKGYLSKFSKIREYRDSLKIKFNVSNSKFNNLLVNKLSGEMLLSSGKLLFNNVSIDSNALFLLNSNFSIDTNPLKPNIKSNIFGKKLDMITLNESLKNFIPQTTSKNNDIELGTWSTKPLNWFRFDKFNGEIKLDIKNVSSEKLEFERLYVDAEMKNDLLYVKSLLGSVFGGGIDLKGNYKYDVDDGYNISISFALADQKLQRMLSSMKTNIENGSINLSGSIFTKGKNIKDIVANLNANIPFKAKKILCNNLDIKEIIDIASRRTAIDKNNIFNNLDNAFNNGKSTIDKLSGKIIVKNGQAKSSNITFSSYFSNGLLISTIDLNNWVQNSLVHWYFTPKDGEKPVILSFNNYGSLSNPRSSINKESLFDYITEEFNVKSQEQLEKERIKSLQDEELARKNAVYIFEKLD